MKGGLRGTAAGVERWRSAMVTLHERAFFTLITGALGVVRSPYNKQNLVSQLQSFLSRADVQRNTEAQLDERDIEIICAVALLDEPPPSFLVSFFGDERDVAAIQQTVSALEERFVLYRRPDDGEPRLALNPLFAHILKKYTEDYSCILPSYTHAPADDSPVGAPTGVFGDNTLAAVLVFVCHTPDLFKTDGSLRKSVQKAAAAIFGGLDISAAAACLCTLGLLRATCKGFSPDEAAIASFAALSPYERRVQYAAARYLTATHAAVPHTAASAASRTAAALFIHKLLSALRGADKTGERVFPPLTVTRLSLIIARAESAGLPAARKGITMKALLDALQNAGLLRPRSGALALACAGAPASGAGIVFNGCFSYIITGEADFERAYTLLRFSAPRKVEMLSSGALVHAEISRASVSRAFDAGMSASAITAAIARLSGGRENETLIWSIHEWEKQYTDVSLFEGITLTLSPERQYLAETDALKSLIYCSPARGVLILNTKNKEVVLDALQKCALDAVSAPQTEAAKERPRAAEQLFLHLPPDADTAFSPRAAAALPVPSSRQDAFDQRAARTRACTDMFLDALARLRLPPDRHNALKARIERRLIVSESQLRAAAGQVSGEKLEARALDYAGKANIAKAALEANETLEIQINGSEERMFVRPLSLEKTVDGAFLTAGPVSAAQNDMQECFSFPLGKIRYLRRIKKSSFL